MKVGSGDGCGDGQAELQRRSRREIEMPASENPPAPIAGSFSAAFLTAFSGQTMQAYLSLLSTGFQTF